MAATYSPTTHTAPTTATLAGVNVTGLSPGSVMTAINDSRDPTYVFLPTSTTSDGYPTGMTPFATGTGAVT